MTNLHPRTKVVAQQDLAYLDPGGALVARPPKTRDDGSRTPQKGDLRLHKRGSVPTGMGQVTRLVVRAVSTTGVHRRETAVSSGPRCGGGTSTSSVTAGSQGVTADVAAVPVSGTRVAAACELHEISLFLFWASFRKPVSDPGMMAWPNNSSMGGSGLVVVQRFAASLCAFALGQQ